MSVDATKFKWTSAEILIFTDNVAAFREGDKAARKALLVSTVLPKFRSLQTSWTIDSWQMKKVRVKEWFQNHGRRTRKKSDQSIFHRKVPMKQVVAHIYRKEVNATVEQLSNSLAGSKEFLSKYQTGVQKVYNSLTSAEQKEAEVERLKWESDKYPKEVQVKNAATKGPQWLRSFSEKMANECGMQMCILEYHLGDDGRHWFKLHDFTAVHSSKERNQFSAQYPDVHEAIKTSFNAYINYVAGDGPVLKSSTRGVRVEKLITDDVGYPILPVLSGEETYQLQYKKGLIRDFIKAHYQLASGVTNSRVPWLHIAHANHKFFDKNYMPPGIALIEPSDMVKDAVNKILDFWRGRQETHGSHDVFQFRNVCVNTRSAEIHIAPYQLQPKRTRRHASQDDISESSDSEDSDIEDIGLDNDLQQSYTISPCMSPTLHDTCHVTSGHTDETSSQDDSVNFVPELATKERQPSPLASGRAANRFQEILASTTHANGIENMPLNILPVVIASDVWSKTLTTPPEGTHPITNKNAHPITNKSAHPITIKFTIPARPLPNINATHCPEMSSITTKLPGSVNDSTTATNAPPVRKRRNSLGETEIDPSLGRGKRTKIAKVIPSDAPLKVAKPKKSRPAKGK